MLEVGSDIKLVRASGARGAGQGANPLNSPGGYSEDATTPSRIPPRTFESDYCGADGGEHEWVVAYWIGGERDENGEHTICRKCHEEYVP